MFVSEDDDQETESNFQMPKRIRVGNLVLTPEDEQFVENCNDGEDIDSILADLNENDFSECSQVGVDAHWKWTAKKKHYMASWCRKH